MIIIDAYRDAMVGIQYINPYNEAAQSKCTDTGLKGAEDSIQKLSKLECSVSIVQS
jgi:hypothetical protein